jgi:hypothetical protein
MSEKPLVIQLREAKEGILAAVNTAIREGLPCYLLEPIIAEVHTQVSAAAAREYELARKQVAENAGEGGAADAGQ